ncbi:MAG TPA: hypothetical protein VLL28_10120 [Hyphomicrobiaceae bacterium]|nr:hypothetical protein [Hyphomicrobiaceae bacterium]
MNEDVDPALRLFSALAMDRFLRAGIAVWRTGAIVLALVALLAAAPVSYAQTARQEADLLRGRNIEVSRAGAAQLPRSEGDHDDADEKQQGEDEPANP